MLALTASANRFIEIGMSGSQPGKAGLSLSLAAFHLRVSNFFDRAGAKVGWFDFPEAIPVPVSNRRHASFPTEAAEQSQQIL